MTALKSLLMTPTIALTAIVGACADKSANETPLDDMTVTIATVNNGDMIRMQGLADEFTASHPDIKLEWVSLEENILRQRVTQDVAAKGGQFDVMTIGTYEVPIWSKQGWLEPLDDMPLDWDVDDFLPSIRKGLSVKGTLYGAPFYGESSMVMYRTDLMDKAGIKMPQAPSWAEIESAAAAMTDKENDVYGICLRGKAGWGENMALLTSMANSFGARWFDENWKPELNGKEWTATVNYYVSMINNYGPPGASTNGFNENLSLFQQGKCGIWIDATVAASFLIDPDESIVADKVGFALAPDNGLGKRGNWLWAWSLAIPSSSDAKDSAKKFVAWATSKEYSALVAHKQGWASAPPGTRSSLYANPEYQAAAPFADVTLISINSADPNAPTVKSVPYTGVQFVAIPEFAGIATQVGQEISAALAGKQSVGEALDKAQALTKDEMDAAGY